MCFMGAVRTDRSVVLVHPAGQGSVISSDVTEKD